LEPVTFVVEEGSVGRSLTFTAVAEWELVPVGRNSAAGVVTSVDVAPGDEVSAGAVLYTIDLRPVVAAVGAVPAFRDLSLRSEGPDVAQLQSLLAELGLYGGEVDGSFGSSTRTAVRAWQQLLGVNDDGVVRAGDVVFVPELPVRVAFSEALTVGARLGGGEEVVLVVPADPVFRVPLSIEQRNLVPLSAEVAVTFPEGVWSGRVDRAVESPEFGQLDLIVTAGDGGSLCGSDCARWVDLEKRTDFRVDIVVIPEASGPVVPIAALHTDAANQPFVIGADGAEIPVTIVAASQGIAVVEGVEAGTVIVLPVGGTE
jgi:peptidoglycan hydrolase-like protein with peptidoglycan-binding domain